jgi:hypothetical protein
MGRVFTEQEVRDRRVPEAGDFAVAVKAFKESVNEGIETGLLDGAAVFGSVAVNLATIRSDFDCLIVPVDHSPEALIAARGVVANVFDYSMNVPIGASLHHRERLASGEHELDRFFGAHLTGPNRIVVGNDPGEYMKFGDAPARDIILSYIRHKKRGIGQLIASPGGSEDYKGFQRLLELPVAIGRKALMVIDEVEGSRQGTTNSADKKLVLERALALFEELGANEVARLILQHDKWYDEELAEALESGMPERGYSGFLEELDGLALKASPWLDELDTALQRRLPQDN